MNNTETNTMQAKQVRRNATRRIAKILGQASRFQFHSTECDCYQIKRLDERNRALMIERQLTSDVLYGAATLYEEAERGVYTVRYPFHTVTITTF